MANLKDAVKTVLTGDATLSSILTGGIVNRADLGRRGLTQENMAKDGNGNIAPQAVIVWRNEVQNPELEPAEMRFFEIHLYDFVGYANIDPAVRRIKTLLHRVSITSDNERVAETMFLDTVGEFVDESVGDAASDKMRFQVLVYRG